MQLSPIVLIIIGLILKANPMWFNGAATVGAFCLWAGIILLVLAVVIWIVIAIIASRAGSRSRHPWDRRW